MAGDSAVEVQVPDLRTFLADLKDFSPRLAREIRRDMRKSGDDVIAEQRAALSGPLPGTRTISIGTQGRTLDLTRSANRRRTTGLREDIKRGLKVRVLAGKTRQGVELRSTGPRRNGYNMARVWNAREFRHPVFGTDEWEEQAGQPYFWAPAIAGRDRVHTRVSEAIDRGLAAMSKG